MVNEQYIKTLATSQTAIAMVSVIAHRVQNPESQRKEAPIALQHKVASALNKHLSRHY